ncbi:SDR family oxidoreductase [Corallococcus aberystwythensis]|uniref:SDR family oxidoreductase n=1 Tax=Corallococcus aberystwythensis TaxID=2316722 RepID=A0A3A8PT65_9BACT|nr:SDR family oxidoreductase [Corallococcus aberystwythensis]RKH58240.1 SDR family oxidoreductase [Corallococcus aberystwythensis]
MSAGPWALIVGASSGSGAAIAVQVARQPGLHVFGMHRGRYLEQAAEVEQQVLATGRRMVMMRGDAGTPEGVARGADALLATAGPRSVKLFVHALASASVGRFITGDKPPLHPRQLARTFEAMAHSFVYWAQALMERDLLTPSARLLGLTNPLTESLLHNCGAITAAKAALEIYVRHLALELGPLGHRVNLLKFGTVMTPAIRHVYTPEVLAQLEEAHRRINPAGRMCTLEEVARIVPSLLGEEAEWFNGATIDFTGGMTLRLLDLVLNEQGGPPASGA